MAEPETFQTACGTFSLAYAGSDCWTATWIETGLKCHIPSRAMADALRKRPCRFGALEFVRWR